MGISTGQNVRALVFVKIELDGITLRYCTENIMAKDTDGSTYFWEGRVTSVSDVSAGFNDFRDAQTIVSSLNISLANGLAYSSGANLDSYISTYFWGLRSCTVFLAAQIEETTVAISGSTRSAWYVGAGQFLGPQKRIGNTYRTATTSQSFQLSTSDIVIKGVLGFPNVFTRHDDKQVDFMVVDQRYVDQIRAAPNVFKKNGLILSTPLVTDSMASGTEGKIIPVVYGSFEDPVLPCFGAKGFPYGDISSPASANRVYYQAADDSLLSSGQISIKSFDESALVLDVGFVTIAQSETGGVFYVNSATDNYDINTAQLLIAAEGKTRGDQIASVFSDDPDPDTLLEHPVEVIYDLLYTRFEVDADDINEDSFTDAKAEDTSVKCRRWIGGEEPLIEVLNELCFEFGLELYSFRGEFFIRRQSIEGSSDLSVTEDDIQNNGYYTQTDPNRAYFNELTMIFGLNPDGNFSSATVIGNEAKIAQHGKEQNISINLKWIYREIDAVERFSLLLHVFSRPLRILSLNLVSRAWDLVPTSILDLTFHIFSAQKFLVRSISKSLKDFTTNLTAWDLSTSNTKNWAADADTASANYAAADAATFGVWHGDFVIEAGFNDTIKVTTSTTATATIPFGIYSTAASLASAIETAINAAVGTNVTVTYSATTRKFTIATVDVSNFTLHWTDTPEIGRSVLGFVVSSNDTGAATYTSDYVVVFDLVEGEAVSAWA